MNELMTNTGTPSLAYHNVFFQVQIYNLHGVHISPFLLHKFYLEKEKHTFIIIKEMISESVLS